MPTIDSWGLADLLAPTGVDAFFRDHWERAPLHRPRHRAAPAWFGLDDVEAWLWSQRRCDADDLLVTATTHSWQRRAPSSTSVEDVAAAFARGETVQINGLHRTWTPVSQLAARVGRDLDARIHVNVYLTPPGHQGLPRHADGHDVFVLTLEGSKRWRVFDAPVPLPTPEPTVTDAEYPWDFRKLGSMAAGAPILDVVLEPGSLLYIPRGFPHEAQAQRGPVAVHLAVGVYPLHAFDALHLAVAMAALRDPELRRAIRSETPPIAELLARVAADPKAFQEAIDAVRRRQGGWRELLPAGQLRSMDAEITPDTVLKRRDGVACFVRIEDDEAVLRFGDRVLRAPLHARAALEFVGTHATFAVRELPGLDLDGCVVIARRLHREGLLVR